MKNNYNKTMYACFVGYIVQAVVNNFVPLLFLTFHNSYGIALTQITFLVTINLGVQLLVDAASVGCSGGPTYMGIFSGMFGDNLGQGILCAVIFPILLLGLAAHRKISSFPENKSVL